MIAPTQQSAKFVVAKYVPDVRRMEPRNIGVFVWLPGAIESRFLPTAEATKFVNEPETYQRWLKFWTEKTAADAIAFHGKKSEKDSPEYLETLLETQKGNYRLMFGGETLNEASTSDVGDIADHLFAELIAPKAAIAVAKTKEKESGQRLLAASMKVFDDLGIRRHTSFRTNRPFACRIQSVWHEFKFHVAWGESQIQTVFQRVPLNELMSVNHTAFMFEWLNKASTVDIAKDVNRVAFVDTSDILLTADAASKRTELLSHFSTAVLDLARPDQVTERVANLLGI